MQEMTPEQYADKHSVFNDAERKNIRYEEKLLLARSPQEIFPFWNAKRQKYLSRLELKLGE